MGFSPCFPSIINILTAFSQEGGLEKTREQQRFHVSTGLRELELQQNLPISRDSQEIEMISEAHGALCGQPKPAIQYSRSSSFPPFLVERRKKMSMCCRYRRYYKRTWHLRKNVSRQICFREPAKALLDCQRGDSERGDLFKG